jgi:hypothetical protein
MILTLKTTEIAAHRRYRERGRPGIEMKDGFFFHRINIEGDGAAVDKAVKFSFPVLSHPADPPFRRGNNASMVAEMALYFSRV